MTSSKAVAKREGTAPALPDDASPILKLAEMTKGMDVEAVKALVQLHREEQDREAKRQFNTALAEFKQECPAIPRNSTGNMVSKTGAKFQWKYADLDDIQPIIDPLCAKVGLSYSWTTERPEGRMKVSCVLRHAMGHSEDYPWETGTKAPGADMADWQNDSKAWTAARRQSLIQALGLKAGDPDGDRVPGAAGGSSAISEDQANTLYALIDEVGQNTDKFLAVYGVGRIEDLPAANYSAAVGMLERKRK